jgi:hypothetical protein
MAVPTVPVQQFAETPGIPQIPVYNYSGSTAIAAYVAVRADAANNVSDSNPYANQHLGVLPVNADGDVVIGVMLVPLDTKSSGTMVPVGSGAIVPMTADGAITGNTFVMASGGSSKKGFAKAQTSAAVTLGIALNTAADGEQVLVLLGGAKNA